MYFYTNIIMYQYIINSIINKISCKYEVYINMYLNTIGTYYVLGTIWSTLININNRYSL